MPLIKSEQQNQTTTDGTTTMTLPTTAVIKTFSPSSVSSRIHKQTSATAGRLQIEAERSIRAIISKEKEILEKTAQTQTQISFDSKIRTEQNQSNAIRLHPSQEQSFGIPIGQQRNDQTDILNLNQRIQISNAAEHLKKTTTEKINPRDADDIIRSSSKLQRRCNHTFTNMNTCVFCNKFRNDHV